MKINNCKIGLVLLLSLSLLPAASVLADSNSLTQLDIRKNNSSSSAVDVTLYTTSPYNDSVAVTKKSDNKYVILIPNVSSSAGKAPDLSGLKDVISNVDVKSVNDGAGSYTKVTLITTKPVNIKTHTQKSLPLTSGQKAYKELLAKQTQTGTHTNAPVPVKPALKEVPKTVVTVNKPAQPVKLEAKAETVKPAVQKKANILEKAQSSIKEAAAKKEIKTAAKPVNVIKKTEAPKTSVQNNNAIEQTVKNNVPAPQAAEKEVVAAVTTPAVTNAAAQKSEGVLSQVKRHISGRISPNMPITIAMVLIPVLGLIMLFKLIKASMNNSNLLKKAFISNLKNKKDSVRDYEHIINADMNWQEKYQKFVTVSNSNYEKSPKKLMSENVVLNSATDNEITAAKPAEQPVHIIPSAEKQPLDSMPKILKEKKNNKPKAKVEINEAVREMERQINKMESERIESHIESSSMPVAEQADKEAEYVASLERMLHDSPEVENIDLDDDVILNQLEQNFKDITVHSEDNSITSKMSNVPNISKVKKLKAFANKSMLEESQRNKPLPKTREEVKRSVNREGKHVNLGYSKLHSNPRLLEGANLSAADLIAKSSRLLPNSSTPKISAVTPSISMPKISKPEIKHSEPANDKGYSMATIDEFFELTDDQRKVTASSELSNKVAGSLAKVKPSINIQKATPKKMTNPISQLKSETKESYINGLIVKSGFNIDSEKGFYLVNLDGEMALIGRIKEEVFVLKKFDRPIEKPLQVRQDNPNVYMVKADGFRSLVEVNDNKMGVLIEL